MKPLKKKLIRKKLKAAKKSVKTATKKVRKAAKAAAKTAGKAAKQARKSTGAGQKHVVVLHGIAVNKLFMTGISGHLKKQGYTVHAISYPSRAKSWETLVDEHIAPEIAKIPAKKVDFVVHSMGGLLTRVYALKYGAEKIGRVVMIGTPNHGSDVADFLKSWPIYKWYFGEAGQTLGTTPDGIHAKLPPLNFECGIIAGENHLFRFVRNALMPNLKYPHDGAVSVESTKVAGMKDHTVIDGDHSQMVWMPRVWKLTSSFLKNGKFAA
jgi:triacylglycerol lipase